MKLISMKDFVLEQDKLTEVDKNPIFHFCRCIDYANFLNKPLELGMFVPCDEWGNVLKGVLDATKANGKLYANGKEYGYDEYVGVFQQARENVLFKVNMNAAQIESHLSHYSNINEMMVDFDIELTSAAIKNLGL